MQTEIFLITLGFLTIGFLTILHGINLIFIRLSKEISEMRNMFNKVYETAQPVKETVGATSSGETSKAVKEEPKKRGRPSKSKREFSVF